MTDQTFQNGFREKMEELKVHEMRICYSFTNPSQQKTYPFEHVSHVPKKVPIHPQWKEKFEQLLVIIDR
jgi:hypothetical protein